MSHLQPVAPDPMRKSYLDLMKDCDNFPYADTEPELYAAHISTYYLLFIPPCPRALGYLLPSVALTLKGIEGWTINESERTLTLTLSKRRPSATLFSITSNDPAANEGDGSGAGNLTEEQQRSAVLARTVTAMHATGHFQVLAKWRNELYPIYWRPPPVSSTQEAAPGTPDSRPKAELLASMERSASPLFGIVTYGCHLTGYVRRESKDTAPGTPVPPAELFIWVPKRAHDKDTYPGMLDQTVAGGIATGETPWESLVRECAEEASLPAELVVRKARAVSTVSYFHVRDERAGGETRLLQPEIQYCYDLDLTGETDGQGGEVQPKPGDDEVESFEIMAVTEVQEALGRGEFKPNCALVLIDFLVRHGYITAENEDDYQEIITRLHRRLEFPTV